MATTLEIINGISQAAANAYDGALDDKGEPVKVGLKREEGHILHDKRVMDGIKYHSEVNLKDVQGDKMEKEIEQMIGKIATFLKKEYKSITGKALTLTKEGNVEARMQYMNHIRCWVTAHCIYNIGGIKDVEAVKEESGDRLDKKFKDFLNQSTGKKSPNDKRKNVKAEDPTFTPWNMKK